ncbi:MAG: helix-turn-helix transcriptional regulator [Alphaproteobacteria bacterium]|nr:helix-turn-helix transcriptional regulator [Alphaproteobacteria bacterium]
MSLAEKSLECPALITVKLVDSKWKLLILWELSHGVCRFGDILKNIDGISQKVLTQNLRSLESDGLISRKVYAEVPPRVEYTLTDLARDLAKVLDIMGEWGIKYAELKTDHPIKWYFNKFES